jgi:predicted GIY-YIG superfamily endonuclease
MYKIYRIIDNTNGNIYIGRTTMAIRERLRKHKNRQNCMCNQIIKNGDYKIELIEETYDKTRERYWIENTECVNKIIPGRTQKEYYKENKQSLLQKNNEYREKNKDKILNRKKQLSQYQSSWGGDKRNQNNLLSINVNLFR